MTDIEILSDPGEVTAGWLTQVLNADGHDVTVDSFTAENVGTGQVGQNVRFSLNYSRGSGPASIVGKFASADPTSRATGVANNNYLNEVRFYQRIRHTVAVQTPKVLFTDIHENDHRFCVIMEDLAPAQQGDQIDGCTVEEAELAMTQAANLHGPRWGDPSLHDEPSLTRETPPGALKALWDMVYPGFVQRYQHRLDDTHLNVIERFTTKLSAWTNPPEGPFTITHGDFRLDNMLFGGPYPLAIVDWQTPSISNGTSDVSYFLGAGLLPEVRRDAEDALVRRYHDALVVHGVNDYSFDACWADYRRYAYSGVVMAVIASMIVGQTDRGDDMFMAMASRHAQQALDLDAELLLD